MIDFKSKYEAFLNQATLKNRKMPVRLENKNRNFQSMRQFRNPASPHSFVGIKKRIVLQKGNSYPELKNVKNKRTKRNILPQKFPDPPPINNDIEEIENSISRLTKKIEDCKKARSNETVTSPENFTTELPESNPSIHFKLRNSRIDYSKHKLDNNNKIVTDVSSTNIHKFENDQEHSRIKSNFAPVRTLTLNNIPAKLSAPNKKTFHNGMVQQCPRKLKKIHDRLDRVREFIKSLNASDLRTSTCSDGINHKDAPQKKSGSSDSSEGADAKLNDNYKNLQQIVKARRIVNRNRLFASRAPLLATVVEEPEKEEEEAKLYEML